MEKLITYLNQKLKKERFEVLMLAVLDEEFEYEVEAVIRLGGKNYVTITCMEKWLLDENFEKYADKVFNVLTEKVSI